MLPARIFRRHAPAGHDRHGPDHPAGNPHRRRTDHRARRHRPGRNPRPHQETASKNSAPPSSSSPTTSPSSPKSATTSTSCTPDASSNAPTSELFHHPLHAYTRALLKSIPATHEKDRNSTPSPACRPTPRTQPRLRLPRTQHPRRPHPLPHRPPPRSTKSSPATSPRTAPAVWRENAETKPLISLMGTEKKENTRTGKLE